MTNTTLPAGYSLEFAPNLASLIAMAGPENLERLGVPPYHRAPLKKEDADIQPALARRFQRAHAQKPLLQNMSSYDLDTPREFYFIQKDEKIRTIVSLFRNDMPGYETKYITWMETQEKSKKLGLAHALMRRIMSDCVAQKATLETNMFDSSEALEGAQLEIIENLCRQLAPEFPELNIVYASQGALPLPQPEEPAA